MRNFNHKEDISCKMLKNLALKRRRGGEKRDGGFSPNAVIFKGENKNKKCPREKSRKKGFPEEM